MMTPIVQKTVEWLQLLCFRRGQITLLFIVKRHNKLSNLITVQKLAKMNQKNVKNQNSKHWFILHLVKSKNTIPASNPTAKLKENLVRVSPLDGRYARATESARLGDYFSECALMKYRVRVEVEYFLALSKILPDLQTSKSKINDDKVRKIWQEFSVDDAVKIKETEKITNHDVKAVEYFVKDKLTRFL